MEETNIELRSEKVRNIVGKIPPATIRYGIAVICVVLLMLVVVAAIIPYHETLNVKVAINAIPPMQIISADADGIVIFDTIRHSDSKFVSAKFVCENRIYPLFLDNKNRVMTSNISGGHVHKGDLIAILKKENTKIFGIAEISQDEINKVAIGQIIELSLPDKEVIQGKICEISSLPNKGKFKIKIDFADDFLEFAPQYIDGRILVSTKSILRKIAGH